MSTEQQLAAVVSAANNLTNIVTSKVDDIDKAVEAARRKYEVQLVSLEQRLPRLALTRNFNMTADATGTLIDGWAIHQEVTATKLRTVTAAAQIAGRPQADVDFMLQVQADVREQYPDFDIISTGYWRTSINVWQMKWSDNQSSPQAGPWLAFPYSVDSDRASGAMPVSLNSCMTFGAFVRVIEGSISGFWSTQSEKGKWRWCSEVVLPAQRFGHYAHPHPMRNSAGGVVEVMLVGVCTGVVAHPADWGTMLALG
ncbi:hypothetical protein SB759_18380 [Pseudomonas sp. SIMBA_059]